MPDELSQDVAEAYQRIQVWVLARHPDLSTASSPQLIVDRVMIHLARADRILSGKFNQVLIDKIGALVTEIVEGGRKP